MLCVQNYINEELLTFLSSDEKVNQMFEIVPWKHIGSIYLRYKENISDGYIITSSPYVNDGEMVFKIMITFVDSCKQPKPNMIQFVNQSVDAKRNIRDYITAWAIQC